MDPAVLPRPAMDRPSYIHLEKKQEPARAKPRRTASVKSRTSAETAFNLYAQTNKCKRELVMHLLIPSSGKVENSQRSPTSQDRDAAFALLSLPRAESTASPGRGT